MATNNGQQYLESLKKLHPTAYILGEKVENPYEHPLIKHMVAGVAKTFDLAQEPVGRQHLVSYSKLIDAECSRFIKFYESQEDLLAKIEMLKYLSQNIGTCFMRCTGMDAMNSVGIEIYNCDQKYKTPYTERFRKFVGEMQRNDFVVFSGVTDVKGDRSQRPSQQKDPDVYLHIVDRNKDGIIVKGAKIHQTGSLCAHWGLIVPTREMREDDKDWSVCFATPVDAPGIIHVYGRGTLEARAMGDCDLGNAHYSKFAPMVIFDNVFVPWEYVFLCGEYEFAGPMVRNFGSFHRHSHGGCKCGVGDVLIGAAALAADYNGLKKVSHINAKLAEMIKTIQAIYGCSIASSVKAKKTLSGIFIVDHLLSNTAKLYEGKELYEVIRNMIEIAGGQVADLPSDMDMSNPEIGPMLKKYLHAVEGVSTEDRLKLFRLIEKLAFESRDVVSNIHGGGSPETHKMMVLQHSDLEGKKKIAKGIAGIES
jgi:4-hydroxybutyryl-CoA dehydratase/vinylacetyl-CoA-Delta-isomerase